MSSKRVLDLLKKILSISAVAAAALIVSCTTVDNNDVPFIVLINHFNNCGIKINSITALEKENVGAQAAFVFRIGSRDIGIYKFDHNLSKHKRKLDRVSDTGVFYVRGNRFKAIRNGSFIMIDHDTHPEREKIEKVFKAFGK